MRWLLVTEAVKSALLEILRREEYSFENSREGALDRSRAFARYVVERHAQFSSLDGQKPPPAWVV
jgi:hypothetical protein